MNLSTPLTEALKFIPGIIGIHFDEKPSYEVLESGELEVRSYPPLTLLSRTEKGRHEWAVNKAFSKLAKFIFTHDISMTVPVFQKKTPGRLKLSFYIPDSVNLPKIPNEFEVEKTPARKVAVFSYSGLNNPRAMEKARNELLTLLSERDDLHTVGTPFYAQYDSPSTIPILRTNEVMIELS